MAEPVTEKTHSRDALVKALQSNYVIERRNAETYEYLSKLERDPQRSGVLKRLADAESSHAEKWARKLKSLGSQPPPASGEYCSPLRKWLLRGLGVEAAIRKMEAEEEKVAHVYLADIERVGDDEARTMAKAMQEEEKAHGRVLTEIFNAPAPAPTDAVSKLAALSGHERHHTTGGWLGSAIYGVNDGLGAVFGIVSGMAGYGAHSGIVLASGLAGMIASALSMGSGAWLAAKSEREAYEAEITRERREMEANPEEERQELELMYQLKGFSESESKLLAQKMSENPELMLKTKAHEELGLSEGSFPHPWIAALSAGLSTTVGAFIPIIPFFFTGGTTAVFWSLAISIAAHFVVGAGKTLVTGLNWFKSGMEMTLVSVLAAIVTYGFGYVFAGHGHAMR